MQNILVDQETYVARLALLGFSKEQAVERYRRICREMGDTVESSENTHSVAAGRSKRDGRVSGKSTSPSTRTDR